MSEVSLATPPPKLHDTPNLELLQSFDVHPSGKDALLAYWQWREPHKNVQPHLRYAQIFYLPEGSSAIRTSPPFVRASTTEWNLQRLHADTHYQVCIRVLKRSNFSSSPEDRLCKVASTQLVHMRASIGSSVGAFLALVIIVIIVLLSQKTKLFSRRKGRENSKRRTSSQQRSLWSSTPPDGIPSSLIDEDPIVYPEMMSYYYCDLDPKCFDGLDSQKTVLIPVFDDEMETSSIGNSNKTVTFKDDENTASTAVLNGGHTDSLNDIATADSGSCYLEETDDIDPNCTPLQTVLILHPDDVAAHEMTSVNVNVHRPDTPPDIQLSVVPEAEQETAN